ncbi:MAG: hypothetical protein ACI4TV_01595 [Paludibacteraceae bacterium]
MRKFCSVLIFASCLLVSPLCGAVEVVFSERALVNADSERGQLQMYADNETYVAALTINGWQAGKEQMFSSQDVALGGLSMLGRLQGQDTAYIDIIEVLNGQLRIAGDTMKMSATLVSRAGELYNLHFWYAAPAQAVENVSLQASHATLEDQVANSGRFLLFGMSDDGNHVVYFAPQFTPQLAGVYETDGLFVKNDLLLSECFVAEKQADGFVVHRALTGQVSVKVSDAGQVTATGWYLCDNAVKYVFTMNTDAHLLNDEPAAPLTISMTDEKYAFYVDDSYFAKYGQVDFYVGGKQTNEYMIMVFAVSALDGSTIIPAGTYPINDTEQAPSVMAGSYSEYDGLMPSYYGYMVQDQDGWYIDETKPFYYIVSGEVRVAQQEGKLHIVVDAANSYNVPVKIDILTALPTAIEEVGADKTDARKVLRDGRLLILRGDKAYDVLGGMAE